jgi:hypothetical protein
MLNKNLVPLTTRHTPEEEPRNAHHIEPHQKETSNSRLFIHLQPSSSPRRNKSMDNNIWNHFLKVDLNKFDGSDPSRLVTQLEHYFSLGNY